MLPTAASAVDSAARLPSATARSDRLGAGLEASGRLTAAEERQIGEPGQPADPGFRGDVALSARACSSHARPSLAWP